MLISIIIPMRNEVEFAARCLDSLLSQIDLPDDVEILCVDGGSIDGTREIVAKIAEHDDRIRLLDNPHKIVPTAMNIGIREAQGEYIIRIDCHSEFPSDYISRCIAVSQRTGADNVGGYIKTLPGADTAIAVAIAEASSSKFGVGNSMFRLDGPEQEVDTVPFGVYQKGLFEKIGFYDERLVRNQDIELNSRIRKTGGRIIISPEIRASYHNRATYRGLWQQAFNNGLWNPYTIWLVGSGLSIRHFVPMFFVLGLITFTIGAFLWWPVKWILLCYILLYLCPAIFFSLKHILNKKNSPFLVLWSYIVLHMAYGIGSIWSIITIPFKFPNRHKKEVGKPLADRKM